MAADDKTSVTIPAEIIEPLQAAVISGEFASIDEALRDLVGQWQHDRWETPQQTALLRLAIEESLNDPKPSLSYDEVKAGIVNLPAGGDPRVGDAAG
ncbi:MAG: type II toxin-antitoxin system ParD family antitoxin [Gemmatimonadaceae bacterium]|nr:type II toxin-antitoxin system ParD family antitoxin [Acetobacteraceae bacterium]